MHISDNIMTVPRAPVPREGCLLKAWRNVQFWRKLDRDNSLLTFTSWQSTIRIMMGGCIPSFHSPETPQSNLYVFVLCFHHSLMQPGGISKEAREIKHSALRKNYWTAWSYAYSSTVGPSFSETLCYGVGRPHSWHFLASLLSLLYSRMHRALSGTIHGFPLSPYLEGLSQSSRAVCSLIHPTPPLLPRSKPASPSAFCCIHLAVDVRGIWAVLSPLLSERHQHRTAPLKPHHWQESDFPPISGPDLCVVLEIHTSSFPTHSLCAQLVLNYKYKRLMFPGQLFMDIQNI